MLTEICAEIRNYFSLDKDKLYGDFSVVNGQITPSFYLEEGQYYRIVGSVLNDGVHQKDDELIDEASFHGAVWKMRIPKAILDLDEEIAAWQAENGSIQSANMSPYTSESFGGYSYAKSSGGSSGSDAGATAVTWQAMFAKRLNPYRKIRAI